MWKLLNCYLVVSRKNIQTFSRENFWVFSHTKYLYLLWKTLAKFFIQGWRLTLAGNWLWQVFDSLTARPLQWTIVSSRAGKIYLSGSLKLEQFPLIPSSV